MSMGDGHATMAFQWFTRAHKWTMPMPIPPQITQWIEISFVHRTFPTVLNIMAVWVEHFFKMLWLSNTIRHSTTDTHTQLHIHCTQLISDIFRRETLFHCKSVLIYHSYLCLIIIIYVQTYFVRFEIEIFSNSKI